MQIYSVLQQAFKLFQILSNKLLFILLYVTDQHKEVHNCEVELNLYGLKKNPGKCFVYSFVMSVFCLFGKHGFCCNFGFF